MEYNEKYELVINYITASEFTNYKETFEEYKDITYLCLNHKGCHLFEDGILSHYAQGVTLETILSQNKHQFRQGGNHVRNGKREKTWYDLWSSEIIVNGDDFFDFFFVYKMRNMNLLQIDDYLSYHLEHSFNRDTLKFMRFLTVTMRAHSTKLSPEIIKTVEEWMKVNGEGTELSGAQTETKKKKKTITREPGDNITSLNLVQTAYFINLLKESKIIIKEDDLLPANRAGEAFNILTGYSKDTLRLRMNLKGQSKVTRTDRKAVREILNKTLKLIDKENA